MLRARHGRGNLTRMQASLGGRERRSPRERRFGSRPRPSCGWYAGTLSDEEKAAFLAALTDVYDMGICRADAAMGAALDLLEAGGWCGARCPIVIASDHGELQGEHGRIDHGFSVDEGNARVPVLMRGGQAPSPTLAPLLAGAEVYDLVREGTRRAVPPRCSSRRGATPNAIGPQGGGRTAR